MIRLDGGPVLRRVRNIFAFIQLLLLRLLSRVYPGKPIFLSSGGNENYYTNALVLLVRTNRVVIFIAIK